jgi:hypothetical protein
MRSFLVFEQGPIMHVMSLLAGVDNSGKTKFDFLAHNANMLVHVSYALNKPKLRAKSHEIYKRVYDLSKGRKRTKS